MEALVGLNILVRPQSDIGPGCCEPLGASMQSSMLHTNIANFIYRCLNQNTENRVFLPLRARRQT
ncbi:hypothetical protein PCH70_14250 [Pseudomonas cichorii JBC1]|nr:hypothetical protein PCH70_14250 [Pseudomonas cichorii JBC1]